MRPFVVLLMSLAVCLQGHAGVRVMDASCPMWRAHAVQAMHQHAANVEQCHHHHDHGQTPAASGSHDNGSTHCHGHLGCDPVSAGLLAAPPVPVLRQLIAPLPAGVTPAFRSYTVLLLWRPPARS